MSDNEPIPGSVFNPRQVRTLKIVVIVMSILLVLGFALLIAGLYYQATKIGQERPSTISRKSTQSTERLGGEVSLSVPADAEVRRIVAEGGRVILHLKGSEGEQVIIFDPDSGNAVTRLRLMPQ